MSLSRNVYLLLFLDSLVLRSDLMTRLMALVKVREDAQLKKTDGAKKNRVTGITKLDDANFAVCLDLLTFPAGNQKRKRVHADSHRG